MYPAGATGAQAAPQGPTGPTASPAYSSYQPTPTQGYQVGGQGRLPSPARARSPSPITHFPPQNVASQAPQSLPAMSQPPQSGAMGYMGTQSVSMGYQPYGMQVRDRVRCPRGKEAGGGLGRPWPPAQPPSPPGGSPSWWAFDFPSQKRSCIGIQGSFTWGSLHFHRVS